jgi:hypothetical protein
MDLLYNDESICIANSSSAWRTPFSVKKNAGVGCRLKMKTTN